MKTDSKKRIIVLGLMVLGLTFGLTSSNFLLKKQPEKEYTYISTMKEKEESPRIELSKEPIVEAESIIIEEPKEEGKENLDQTPMEEPTEEFIIEEKEEVSEEPSTPVNPIVYDNMTLEELSAKLDRSLNSTLTGTGNLFATYAIQLGIDPYIAVAIVLEETGCKWNCSALVKSCNNVGGQKGGPSCNGGSYKSYPTLEAGIKGFLDNLYNNYYALGLTTPELINTKYAASTAWATKINNYIVQIKAA